MDLGERVDLEQEEFLEQHQQLLEPLELPIGAVSKNDRLTFRAWAHQEHPGENPVSAHASYWEYLERNEEPFSRRFRVGEFWRPLADCWRGQIESPGLVFIEHRTQGLQAQPTEEELARWKQFWVALAVQSPAGPISFGRCRPGRPAIWEPGPIAVEQIVVRSTQGETTLAVTVFSS